MQREDEIEAFKANVNLSRYAAGQGYLLDRKATSRNSAVMRSDRDKIIVTCGTNGHWLFFSVDDEGDNGTIIDFVQNRQNLNLGQVRKELRPWLDGSAQMPEGRGGDYVAELLPIAKDIGNVRARLAAMEPVCSSAFLEKARAIPKEILEAGRFAGRIYQDERGNSVFPHFNQDGVCGYEVKNAGFTGFAPGGEKGLWCSRTQDGDSVMVIAETAIDALSYAALNPDPQARYFSTAGAMNPAQPSLLQKAFEKMASGARVILALDNDEGGDSLAEQMKAIFRDLALAEAGFVIDRPEGRGEDWNDALRASKQNSQQHLETNL